MLSPITRVPCWPGLQAGFELQLTLARWLCDNATTPASITKANVETLHADPGVQEWLWRFLRPRADQRRLLNAAKLVASRVSPEKQRLREWLDIVADVAAQFQNSPPHWPAPPSELPQWSAFKDLMQAFYEKLKSVGLPFDEAGQPTVDHRVTYQQFVDQFKAAHSERVCVVCGDHLRGVQVDHWIGKANYPVLSVAPDNLLPMCCDCNGPPGKGKRPVYALGVAEAFQDWFHPHHRSGYGRIELKYDPTTAGVVATAINAPDNARTSNLDNLVQLSKRWTSEFKAEYRNKQKEIRQLVTKARLSKTPGDIEAKFRESLDGLVADRPNYFVHRVLHECVLEPDRLNAWLAEL